MIIYTKNDSSLNIPVGLGPNVGPLDASLVPLEVDSSTVAQSITPSGDGFSSVTVNPYTVESLTVDPSTMPQAILPENADAFSSVVVNPYYLAHTAESITQNGQYVIAASDYGADGLADVTLDVSVESSYNWILEARKGTLRDLSGYSLPVPERNYQYAWLFRSTYITDMPTLEIGNGILGENYVGVFLYAFHNTSVQNVEIGFTEINGEGDFKNAFSGCSQLTSVSFPELVYAYGEHAFNGTFDWCPNLTSVSFPKLKIMGTLYGSENTFEQSNNLVNFTVHPDALKYPYEYFNIIRSATHVTNLTLTAPVTNSLYVPWQPRLSAESVKGILEKLDLTVSGKHVDFYDGLTVRDDAQGSIRAAYNAAVNAGWTINGLVLPEIEIVSPAEAVDGLLDLSASSSFTFLAEANWTAAADDPSISLSAYSGISGSNTITVSVPQGYIGLSKITLSTADYEVTLEAFMPEDISDFTRVDYIGSTGQQIELGNTLSKYSVIRATYQYEGYNGDMFIGVGINDSIRDSEYNWRIFNYGQSTVLDVAWVDHGGTRSWFNGIGAALYTKYTSVGGIFTDDDYVRFGYYNYNGPSYGLGVGQYTPDYAGSGAYKMCFASPGDYGYLWELQVYDRIGTNDIVQENGLTIPGKQPLYNYVPMRRNSTGDYGLFETIRKQFYTAAGITGGMDQV